MSNKNSQINDIKNELKNKFGDYTYIIDRNKIKQVIDYCEQRQKSEMGFKKSYWLYMKMKAEKLYISE